MISIIVPLTILILQNIVIFYKHYFQDFGFPWDFLQGYYAIVVYWTSLVSQGYIPTWVPFAQMGYPADLMLQSGMHYPPFWFFPLFKIEYTLNAASVFQAIHVLFGAIGMLLFLRTALESNQYALVGAFAFQFFGGFYSNAEHADIIRAFALTPWFFYATYLDRELKVRARHLLIPILVLLMATGGYPGNFISSAFMIVFFVLAQWLTLYTGGADRKNILHNSLTIIGLAVLGLGIAFFHLAPGWLYREYMHRSDASFFRLGLGIEFLPGLFLNNNIFDTEISMSSTFITLPMTMLVAFVTKKMLKRWFPLVVVGILGTLMVAGPQSVFWYIVTTILPPLKLSRFPTSDYRIFVALVLFFFAVIGFKAIVEREFSIKEFFLRLGIVSLFVFQLIYIGYQAPQRGSDWLQNVPVIQAILMLAITVIVFGTIYFAWLQTKPFFYTIKILVLLLLVAFDANRVLPNMKTWQIENVSHFYESYNWPLIENGRIISSSRLVNWPERRPARKIKRSLDYAWEGYITGNFVAGDRGPYILDATYNVNPKSVLFDYMVQAWRPLLFNPEHLNSDNAILSLQQLKTMLASFDPIIFESIYQTRYGINQITYQVFLDRPKIMVENEVYFPGWTAKLIEANKVTEIAAFPTNSVLRSWELPAGQYQMVASFEFPHIQVYRSISVVSLLLYLFVVSRFILHKKDTVYKNSVVDDPHVDPEKKSFSG